MYYIKVLQFRGNRGYLGHTDVPVAVPPTRHILQEFIYICVIITNCNYCNTKILNRKCKENGVKIAISPFSDFQNCNKLQQNCNSCMENCNKIAISL